MKINNYEISSLTLAIIPISDNESKIIEEKKEIIVKLSTVKIIDNSCKFFGSSYDGRIKGTQDLINIKSKSPVIIEESGKIIFFPTSSPRISKCMWISLNNICDYYKKNDETVINFCCGKKITVPFNYGIIDNQVLRATRLLYILMLRTSKNNKKSIKN